MIPAQPPSERTPIQKIAARSESLSVRLSSGTEAIIDVEISMRGSLGIVTSAPASAT
jgi:hypothetical protein